MKPFSELFGAPEYPSKQWFDDEVPEWLEPGQGLTILDSGEWAAYFAMKDTCIIDGSLDCWTAPASASNYAAFHQQSVMTAEGELISCGVIGNTGGHAGTRRNREALEFYQNPNLALMRGRAHDNEFGSWVGGSLLPHLTYGDVDLIRRCALSGHWEWFNYHPTDRKLPWPQGGQYDCLGPTLVNRPGLPLAIAASVSGHPGIFGTNVEVCDCEDNMQTVIASVIGDTDLPLVDSEWDESAAVGRVETYATTEEGIDFSTYSRAFFFQDGDPETTESYSFPFADFIDEELVAVSAGVEAAQSAADESDLSDEDKAAINEKADAYLGEAKDEEPVEAAITIGRRSDQWLVKKAQTTAFHSSKASAIQDASYLARKAAIEVGTAFEALLLVEGIESSDGRTIEKATFRDLPLTLFAQTDISWGHDGAQVAGRIDEIEIVEGSVIAKGVFDSSDFGQEMARLVSEKTLRGISVDIGEVHNTRLEVEKPTGDDISDVVWEEGGTIEIPDTPVHEIYGEAQIMGATIVAHPAFGESQIWIPQTEVDVAAALAAKLDFLVEERVNEQIAKMDVPKLPETLLEKQLARLGEPPTI